MSACDKLGGGGDADADGQTLRLRGGGEKRIYEFGSGKADGNRSPYDGRVGFRKCIWPPLFILVRYCHSPYLLFGIVHVVARY